MRGLRFRAIRSGSSGYHETAAQLGTSKTSGIYYARELFDLDLTDLTDLRYGDPHRYLAVARAISATVIERTLGEWRRPSSPCRGALLWTMNDLWPGAGWGLIDSLGHPKAAYWGARRALAPVALVGVDEGLNGLDIYAYNDGPHARSGSMEVRATRGGATVHHGTVEVHVGPRDCQRFRVDDVFGAFSDPTYAYRFGPRGIDAVSAVWCDRDGEELGRYVYVPLGERPVVDSGLVIEATATRVSGDVIDVVLTANRLAQYVTLDLGTCRALATDDHFMLTPDSPYRVRLCGRELETLKRVFVSSLNSSGETLVNIPRADVTMAVDVAVPGVARTESTS